MVQLSLISILSSSAKANKQIEQKVVPIFMCNKNIKDDDILRLAKQWPKDVASLVLHDNYITSKGLFYFFQQLLGISSYILPQPFTKKDNNLITNIGCKYLSRASIKNITRISLTKNLITDDGLIHLSKAKWNNIEEIYLTLNQICSLQSLIKMKWPKLSALYLASNILQIEGAMIGCDKRKIAQNFLYTLALKQLLQNRLSQSQRINIKNLCQKMHYNIYVNM